LRNPMWFLLLSALLCSGGQVTVEAQDEMLIAKATNKHILIITSQPYVTRWFTTLNNSLMEHLYASLTPQTKLSYEYIDSANIADPESLEILHRMLRKKYGRLHLDLIIGVMPTSSRFLLDHGEEIFPGIPKVYALPAKDRVQKILSSPRTGLVESTSDIAGTIDRIRHFFPDTGHLIVVSGSGNDDLSYMEQTRDILQKLDWPRDITYLAGVPPQELAEKLSTLPAKSAILMLLYVRDRDGNPCTTVQVMAVAAARANAPIFGFYDTILGHGIVGGRLTSAESYGKAIAAAGLRLLGERKAPQTVKVEAGIHDMYDWRQLNRWKIPAKSLPAGSIVHHRTLSYWEANYGKLIIAVTVFLIQAALIFALLVNLIRKRRALHALAIKEQELVRSNRALSTISRCNQTLVRAADEQALLNEVCHHLVEAGGYRLAWVGYKEDDEARSVRPVARAGYEEGYLEGARVTWADNEHGQGPTGRAIRTGRYCAARNIFTEPSYAPWCEQATLHGFASSIALPLLNKGKPFGALNLYSARPDAFDEMETNLLSELTNDLEFGIEALRTRSAREKAEEELERHRHNLEDLVAQRTTELQRINAELVQTMEKAQAADRLKSAFLATMSHELRTPLNSIIGFTGILLQGLVGELNEEQKKQLGMVRVSANHLLSLISDVLDISKIEAGQLQVDHVPFDLPASIRKVEQAIRPLAEKKGLDLTIDIAPDVGTVRSDMRRVEQVLLNLLSNAVKFTEEGRVRLTCSANPGMVIIGVADTGIGIRSEDLDNVFKPFLQIDSGLSRKYEGTGLGLSICKKLVHLLGGDIGVDSVWKEGSTFSFSLPMERSVS